MRIAYVAPYQGPNVVRNRPCLHNLSLAARVKIQLVAELLRKSSHEVEIISQGEVDRRQFKFYPALSETEQFHPDIPIFYLSALPVRFLTGLWEGLCAQRRLKARHAKYGYDAVIIYNMKRAQIACANYAIRRMGLPVVLEYEDDSFVNVRGQEAANGYVSRKHQDACRSVLKSVSGGMGVSPHLMSQLPPHVPQYLLRGVVSEKILEASKRPMADRENWVVYSGTHHKGKGLEELIAAWGSVNLPEWELRIAGKGESTADLEKLAVNVRGVKFQGLLNIEQNAAFLASAKIGINPHDVSRTPGNVFAFKIVEYLAAGTHVVTTPMGALEPELERGITYLPDNSPDTIARTLKQVIEGRRYEQGAPEAVQKTYGPAAVARALDDLLRKVSANSKAASDH